MKRNEKSNPAESDTPSIKAQLDEIRLLEDGWLEYDSKAPSKDDLDWLEKALRKHYPAKAPPIQLFPTPEGDISAECSIGKHEITLDIQLTTKRADWHAFNMETNDDETAELNLADGAGWKQLVSKIQEKAGNAK